MRLNTNKTHCVHGHLLNEHNLYIIHSAGGARLSCKICRKENSRKQYGKDKNNSETALKWRWKWIMQRCKNPNRKEYKNYGGRGINICDRWLDFKNFKADMGLIPFKGATIERKNNNLGYSPDNCMWATAAEQNCNKRSNVWLTHDGKTLTVAQWSATTGISRSILQHRLKYGWNVAEVLSPTITKKPMNKERNKL